MRVELFKKDSSNIFWVKPIFSAFSIDLLNLGKNFRKCLIYRTFLLLGWWNASIHSFYLKISPNSKLILGNAQDQKPQFEFLGDLAMNPTHSNEFSQILFKIAQGNKRKMKKIPFGCFSQKIAETFSISKPRLCCNIDCKLLTLWIFIKSVSFFSKLIWKNRNFFSI